MTPEKVLYIQCSAVLALVSVKDWGHYCIGRDCFLVPIILFFLWALMFSSVVKSKGSVSSIALASSYSV